MTNSDFNTPQMASGTQHGLVRNPVSLRLRKIYCLAGAEFCRPDLEAAWKEIERLTEAGRGLMEVYIAGDEASVEENGRKWDAARAAFYANAEHDTRQQQNNQGGKRS